MLRTTLGDPGPSGDLEPPPELFRVEYDVDRAMRGILESDLPDEFAEDLRTGGARTPSSTEYRTLSEEGTG